MQIFLTNEKAIKNHFQCALWSRDCYPTSHYLIYYMALSRCLLCTLPLSSKLLYISPAMSHFFRTEYDIWAGLDRLVVLKISEWAVKYATFEGNCFMFSWTIFFQNLFKKCCSVCTKKFHNLGWENLTAWLIYNDFDYPMPTHNDPETRIYFWKPLSHKSGPLYLLNCIFQKVKARLIM